MKLELKHLAPYLPYKLKVVEWYLGKQIHDEFIVDCVNWDGKNIGGSDASLDSFELERMFNLRDIKPILRPLSSMTKDEATEIFKIVFKDDYLDEDFPVELRVWGDSSISIKSGSFNRCRRIGIDVQDEVLSIEIKYNLGGYIAGGAVSYNINEWLFAHHFDVFNLIENNLAINKTKL